MQAMILAAGQGKRLRPLTNTIPKPMVKAYNYTLLNWHLTRLDALGFTKVVVNGAYLQDKLFAYLDSIKAHFKFKLYFSQEDGEGLETAGGIIKALPYFANEPFLVINGDIFYAHNTYQEFLCGQETVKNEAYFAHLYLVNNPQHNLKGDYAVVDDGHLVYGHDFTFAGIAWYHPRAFLNCQIKREPLRPYFDAWVKDKKILASTIKHPWFDVGTIERLEHLNTYIKANLHNLEPLPYAES